MNKMTKPELLMPASSLEVLKEAVVFGADAVYIGGDQYGLREKAKNFSLDEMREGVRFAHGRGKKVFVTVNITAHNRDLPGIREYLGELGGVAPDAVIVSDPGVFDVVKETLPEMAVHISTQSNNVNYATFRFWHRMGAARVVAARELSLAEIKEIRENVPDDLEIEAFVHGAMCIAHSGRCLMSNYFTGRDANLGACTHPCRWKYYLMEEKRPGEFLPVEENERGTYLFNSKDLCMVGHVPELMEAGVHSFKVEGRMKTALYVATVARAYRQAIDDWVSSPTRYAKNLPHYEEEVSKCTNRQYTTGFFFGSTTSEAQIYDSSTYVKKYEYLGIVNEVAGDGYYGLEQKNKFRVGDSLEVMKPNGGNAVAKVLHMKDENGKSMDDCPHPGQKVYIRLSGVAEEYDVLRRMVG